jgi:hypothetical protein
MAVHGEYDVQGCGQCRSRSRRHYGVQVQPLPQTGSRIRAGDVLRGLPSTWQRVRLPGTRDAGLLRPWKTTSSLPLDPNCPRMFPMQTRCSMQGCCPVTRRSEQTSPRGDRGVFHTLPQPHALYARLRFGHPDIPLRPWLRMQTVLQWPSAMMMPSLPARFLPGASTVISFSVRRHSWQAFTRSHPLNCTVVNDEGLLVVGTVHTICFN